MKDSQIKIDKLYEEFWVTVQIIYQGMSMVMLNLITKHK